MNMRVRRKSAALKKLKKILKYTGRFFIVVTITLLMIVIFAVSACAVLAYGPFPEWQRRFVATFDETSAMKFVPRIYLSEDKIQSLLHADAQQSKQQSDQNAVSPPDTDDNFKELEYEDGRPHKDNSVVVIPPDDGEKWLEIVDIKGITYKGKMMIIRDPSRVVVGTLDEYGEDSQGIYLEDFIKKYNAAGGTNAGGFYDPNGMGNGGIPDGLVIRNGAIAWGSRDEMYYNVIGFSADNILHVGNMTGQQAIDAGLTSAVSFSPGPVLIKNGEMRTGLGGGMNPRTCIGQTADGTVLLMVIEGRKPDTLGATYDDLAQIMFSYGAVNAANLDGGSSSLMYYNGKQVTRGSNLIGMRRMSTAILILNRD